MGKAVPPTNTPEQKASRSVIEELWRSPGESTGTPEQKTKDIVSPDSEPTNKYADEQCTTNADHKPLTHEVAQHIAECVAQSVAQSDAPPLR